MSLKVSVVVVVKNEEQRIGRCLRSLLAQDFPPGNYEIIVVDGGSDDDTRKIVKEFPVRLIIDEYGTLGHQRNTGVYTSKGEFVAFVDADCQADLFWLSRQVDVLKNSPPKVAAVTGPNLIMADDPPVAKTIAYMQQTLIGSGGSSQSNHVKSELAPVISAPNCNAVYRRQILLENPYDNRLNCGEDAEINFRLRLKGYTLLYNPGAIVWHHRVSTAGALVQKMFNWGFSMAQIARKHRNIIRWYAWLPPVFFLYLVALPLLILLKAVQPWVYGIMISYALVIAIAVLQVLFKQRNLYALSALFLLPLQHISYGLGMIWGLIIKKG